MVFFFKSNKLKYLVVMLTMFFLFACSKKQNSVPDVSDIPVSFKIERFDQLFYDTNVADLPVLKKQFPFLFPQQFDDAFWIEKKKDTLMTELHDEIQKSFNDITSLESSLKDLFQRMKYYYPESTSVKRVITLISEVDLDSKAIYADSLVLISLDTYLGKDHRFYLGFPEYLRVEFEANQILPNIAESFLSRVIPPVEDKTLLAQMIHQGKKLYAEQQLLPNVPAHTIMMYTEEQYKWCVANEEQMWRYFVNDKLLFSNDHKLQVRFIQPSPFSKFYLDIDGESPGRVGVWLGWQIVSSYMKNNNVTLQEMLKTGEKQIFDKSRYKPRK